MWDDTGALKMSANLLFAVSAMLMLYGAVQYGIRLPIFPLREIQVAGEVAHLTREQVEDVVTKEIRGNFFTADLAQARAAFEKLPWVRRVHVRRQWPDCLQVSVEEHKALARWGSTALVSAQAEVFEAAINAKLPFLKGPEGTAQEVVSHYLLFENALEPVGRHISQITLSPRHAWALKLDDGMILELGRDDIESRLAGFVGAYERTVASLPRPASYVDLRYTNGFAVRSSGVKSAGKDT
jgi:cell division protein FtsQ